MIALAAFDGVAVFDGLGLLVVGRDHDDLRVEDIADLVADQVIDGLNVEMLGKAQLNAADDLQLRLALGKLTPQFRNLRL